jgi:hypothetical protein
MTKASSCLTEEENPSAEEVDLTNEEEAQQDVEDMYSNDNNTTED